jgi:6-phosphofructokinase 2
MKKIVTLTINPAIDKSANINQVIAERKMRCKSPRFDPGGGGINVSRAIKKLGGQSTAIYLAGGLTGQMLQQLLDRENIDHHPLPIENLTREDITILEETTNKQFRFVMPGPALNDEEWQRALSTLSAIKPEPDYIVASGSLPAGVPVDFYARAARVAKELGSRIIIDTSGEPLRAAISEGVFMIKPSLRELGELAGRSKRAIEDKEQQAAAAKEIIKNGKCEVVVVSLGDAGILVASQQASEWIPAPKVPVKSKVGAGDSLVAGIVLSLAQGNPLSTAVRFGIAAGTAAVMTPGTELCHREDTEMLYEQMISKPAHFAMKAGK